MQELAILLPTIQLQPNTLVSGGAMGADRVFGRHAAQAGFAVIHLLGPSPFASASPQEQCVTVPNSLLTQTEPALRKAARHLCKPVPKPGYGKKFVQRNYYQVRYADAVYAVGWKSTKKCLLDIEGGTGWSCQLYVNRFQPLGPEPASQCRLYFYEQQSNQWLRWQPLSSEWEPLIAPPRPAGHCAGVGSRSLTQDGARVIECLFL